MAVYKIINVENGRVYVGCTMRRQPRTRWHEHRTSLRFHRHENQRLQADWNAYPAEVFTWVMVDPDGDTEVEQRTIKEYLERGVDLYNYTHKERHAASVVKRKQRGVTKPWTEERRQAAKAYKRGPLSEATKQKIRSSRLANPSPGMTGKRHTEETLKKMRESQKRKNDG